MKTKTVIDSNVMKQLNGKTLKLGIVFVSLGGVLTVLYVILSLIANFFKFNRLYGVCLVMIIVVGVTLLYSYYKAKSQSMKGNVVNEVEFFDTYLESHSIRNGELFQTNKINYVDISKVKETEDFIFVYINSLSAVVINKKVLTEQELLDVKLLVFKNNPQKVK